MRLSTAIALGRHLLKPSPGFALKECGNNELEGCALGMAIMANGISDQMTMLSSLYPWSYQEYRFTLPCGCSEHRGLACAVIAHLFDFHVFGAKDWTLDQLIDWVRSVEPAEPEAEQPKQQVVAESVAVYQ